MRQIKRRAILLFAGAAALFSQPVAAQERPDRPYVVGVLVYETRADFEPDLRLFKDGLRQVGLSEDRNLRIEYRFANYDQYKIGRLAEELVRSKVDLIYAPQPWAVRGAQSATKSLPIVFSLVNDPVGAGYVESLRRPGGNTTGVAIAGAELTAKRVQLMREMFPAESRFAFIYDHDAADACQIELKDVREAGQKLQIEVVEYPYSALADLKGTFVSAHGAAIAAALIPTTYEARRAADEFRAQSSSRGLPLVQPDVEAVVAGGLMSYGPERAWAASRAADYVARILGGANPADLPVELPSRYELVINMKTARALGLEVPLPILLRADRVIE
jgi:putative ABC transport system substrate-binding protein